jgi:hypothetical protein
VYNIQKAVSRLDFAPKLKEIEVTDIKKGLAVFTPKPDKPVSFAALQTALKKAGYTLDSAEITLSGRLMRDDKGWGIVVDSSGQRFALEGTTVDQMLAGTVPETRVEVAGDWKTAGEGVQAREVLLPRSMKKVENAPRPTATLRDFDGDDTSDVQFKYARFEPARSLEGIILPLAPIRTTTPGLTVYKGGAVIPRLYFVRQHLGNLDVSRQLLDLSVSYTPTPRLQLEAEVPVSRTAFDDHATSGSGAGLGNITLWGKYRFYRTVKTYGDRQAAVRFGLELPTGKKSAPSARELSVPAFVRQQITPINGGFSLIVDLAYSQAMGRFIYGGNIQGVLRAERAGFRTGHELRVNTDAEFVIFPLKYRRPTKELFAIFETTFVNRGEGRLDGLDVPGSRSTEYYLAPGLQYVATPQLVIEASFQVPVVRNTGPLVLRTDRNILFAAHYLF